MKVTYLEHSGFAAEYKEYVLIFDWYRGSLPEFDQQKKIYVFASHSHYDHFNKKIFGWSEQYPDVRYILSADIAGKEQSEEQSEQTAYVTANKKYDFDGIKVQTLHSTDEGVAFIVYMEDKVIYHAGDLNWWHWEGEPDEKNTEMRRAYQAEINRLMDEKIDIAFVPVDPRLGEQYCWGLDCFMKRTETKVVFPMHFWGNYSIFNRLALEKCAKDYEDRIVRIEKPGQVFLLDEMDENDRIRVRYSSILQQ